MAVRKTFMEIAKQKRLVNADAQGRLHRSIGATSYEELCNLAKEDANNIEDINLPIGVENAEIHFVDTTQRQDNARWASIQHGREPQARLVVLDFAYHQWGKMKQVDLL